MTGSVMIMMASGSLRSNTFTSNFSNTSAVTPGTYAGQLTFNSDGTTTGNHASSLANWFSPTTTSIGSSFWAKVTSTSGSNETFFGTITTTGWVSISAGANFGVQNSGTSLEAIGTYVVSFATDSAGGNIVGTVSGNYDVGYAP